MAPSTLARVLLPALVIACTCACQSGPSAGPGTTAPPADGGTPGDVSDTAPITEATPLTWTWIPFPQARCRDGSSTGIGVNMSPASSNLLLFFEGGGACFNAETCATNPSSFGPQDFSELVAEAESADALGILSRDDPANPVRDWSFVFVPYCTGDVYAGTNEASLPAGTAAPQLAVGYTNVGMFLERIVPTFRSASTVLLAGVSAGGFGAAVNYERTAQAFGDVPVHLLDDSGPGPFLQDPYLASCLEDQFVSLWKLDDAFLSACGAACAAPNRLSKYMAGTLANHPDRAFGLLTSMDDATVTSFLGFGASDCTAQLPLSASAFGAALGDVRTRMAGDANFGAFYFSGQDHVSLLGGAFDTRTAGGTALTSWVAGLAGGQAANVGP